MNRIFKIAGEFLESVDQRADRSVNATSQPPTYKSRVIDTQSQAAASAAVSSRIRDRYTPKNPRNRTTSGNQRRPMSPTTRSISNQRKTDMEVNAIMNSLNAEDTSHKRSISEQFSQVEEAASQYHGRIASISELSPSSIQTGTMENEQPKTIQTEEHTWGEDENEVGLHITESVDPTIPLSPSHLPITTLEEAVLNIDHIETNDMESLQNHVSELEHDLDEALAQLDANTRALEDKDTRIDILENRLKQMRIDNDRAKEKADVLIDEKDAMIMKLQTEIENLKADYYHLKLEWNEEKERAQRGTQKAEREAGVVQTQLKQLEELNANLKNQLLQLSETSRVEEEKSRSVIKEKDVRIAELAASLAASQKQAEEYLMRFDSHEDRGEEYNEKILFFEKELLKIRQEKEKISKEYTVLAESSRKTLEEYKELVKKYEEQLAEKENQIKKYQKQEEVVKMNKENSYSLLQTQIEQLQQTVMKKQLLLDAVNSEKSSLEYRLADVLRDKARAESVRRLGSRQREEYSTWCDVERGEEEEKTHSRSIARILPDSTPSGILEKVDAMDEVSLSIVQLLQRSPSFRLLFILYFLCIHIVVFILFFRKRSCVCLIIFPKKSTILVRFARNRTYFAIETM